MSRPCGHMMGTIVAEGAVRCMACGDIEPGTEPQPDDYERGYRSGYAEAIEKSARECEVMAAKYETGSTFDERAAEVCIVCAKRLRALVPATRTE